MYLTEETLVNSLSSFINENYYSEMLSEGNIVWIYENEYIPSLFEAFVEENYYLDQLSKSNLEWIFENEYLPIVKNAVGSNGKSKKNKKTKYESYSPYVSLAASLIEAQEKKSGTLRSKNMDKVGEEDEDPNNDGKVDPSDGYILKRRNAIANAKAKAMAAKGKK